MKRTQIAAIVLASTSALTANAFAVDADQVIMSNGQNAEKAITFLHNSIFGHTDVNGQYNIGIGDIMGDMQHDIAANGNAISAETAARTTAVAGLTSSQAAQAAKIASNADDIKTNAAAIAGNQTDISGLRNMIFGDPNAHTPNALKGIAGIQADIDSHQNTGITDNTNAISAETAARTSAVAGLTSSQAAQDAKIASNADGIKTNADAIHGNAIDIHANKTYIDAYGKTITDNTNAISAETAARTTADNALTGRVRSTEQFTQAINADVQQGKIADIARDKTIAGNTQAIATESTTRQAQVTHLNAQVADNTANIANNGQAIADNAQALTTQGQQINGNTSAITDVKSLIRSNAGAIGVNHSAVVIETTRAKGAENLNTAGDASTLALANDADVTAHHASHTADSAQKLAEGNNGLIKSTGAVVTANSHAIAANTKTLANKVDKAEVQADEAHIQQNRTAISRNATTETQHFNVLQSGVAQAQATGEYAQARANQAFANAKANREALNATNHRVADNSAAIANHEQRIQSLESNTNAKFANLDKRIDSVKDEANAGSASAMAQANIPQVMSAGEFGIGAGAGTYADQSAVAVGASFAPRDNLVFKATVSSDTQHNFGAGAGVMISFH